MIKGRLGQQLCRCKNLDRYVVKNNPHGSNLSNSRHEVEFGARAKCYRWQLDLVAPHREDWTRFEMKRLLALSARTMRRLSTADRMMTPTETSAFQYELCDRARERPLTNCP